MYARLGICAEYVKNANLLHSRVIPVSTNPNETSRFYAAYDNGENRLEEAKCHRFLLTVSLRQPYPRIKGSMLQS